jgi:hypothetical protein
MSQGSGTSKGMPLNALGLMKAIFFPLTPIFGFWSAIYSV